MLRVDSEFHGLTWHVFTWNHCGGWLMREHRGRACILYALLSPWRRGVVAMHVLEDVHLADDGVYHARGVEEGDSMHWR